MLWPLREYSYQQILNVNKDLIELNWQIYDMHSWGQKFPNTTSQTAKIELQKDEYYRLNQCSGMKF